jgi:hypothetical protein
VLGLDSWSLPFWLCDASAERACPSRLVAPPVAVLYVQSEWDMDALLNAISLRLEMLPAARRLFNADGERAAGRHTARGVLPFQQAVSLREVASPGAHSSRGLVRYRYCAWDVTEFCAGCVGVQGSRWRTC